MEVQIKDNKIYAPLKDKWLIINQKRKCAKGTYADWWIAMVMT